MCCLKNRKSSAKRWVDKKMGPEQTTALEEHERVAEVGVRLSKDLRELVGGPKYAKEEGMASSSTCKW